MGCEWGGMRPRHARHDTDVPDVFAAQQSAPTTTGLPTPSNPAPLTYTLTVAPTSDVAQNSVAATAERGGQVGHRRMEFAKTR